MYYILSGGCHGPKFLVRFFSDFRVQFPDFCNPITDSMTLGSALVEHAHKCQKQQTGCILNETTDGWFFTNVNKN